MNLDASFGTILIGTWAQSLVVGVSFAQAAHYFSNFPNDSWSRKALVIAASLFTLVALVGAYADAYVPLVILWGNPAAFKTETWGVPVYTIFNSLVGTICNSYLITRFYSLSKNIYVAAILYGIVLAALVLAFISTLLYPGLENITKAERLALIWAIFSATSDISIALALVVTLSRMKTTVKTTKRVIHRVMITAIQSGCTTSVVAFAGMMAIIFNGHSNIPTAFFLLLGSLYLLTLLLDFNMRQRGRSGSRNWSSSRNNPTNSSVVFQEIFVTRAVTVNGNADVELESAQRHDGSGRSQKRDLAVESIRSPEQVKVANFNTK
ncbi:hypothetical protein MSAN_00227900 [Mycena sanguinolenta]|uniref:DUF6534 domain-containing protein n=1 Tax=Mycena sanguinolenta TaxID=230812 RepID=A0A8H7DL07_9AGAR|nr:hypothetical protein MSAN_00227900 [Mycena sanguinolenta]